MEGLSLLIGAALLAISFIGVAYASVAQKIVKRAQKANPEEIRRRNSSGIFIAHGMVRANPGERGLVPEKKLSDYYYDSLTK